MEESFSKRGLFRIVDPLFGKNNIYKMQAKTTVSLGPVMIGTAANKNLPWLQVEIINENNYRKKMGALFDEEGLPSHFALQMERKADFIGISASMTNAVPRAKNIIRDYKLMPEELRPKAIIVGGWHAGDSAAEFLSEGCDVVVHGEGERIIKEIIEKCDRGESMAEISGISYLKDGQIHRNGPEFLALSEEELEALPCPDFSLARFSKIKLHPMSRTRGCSGRCRFCRVRSDPRSISPEKFLENMKVIASKGAKNFFWVDDRSEEELEGFQKCLKGLISLRRHYRFEIITQNRLSLAEKPEVLALMREAGVKMVAIGFESPIPAEIKAMRKPINPDKMVEWTKIFKENGLYVHAMMIFGYPLSTCGDPEIMKQVEKVSVKERSETFWHFIKKAKPDTLQVLLYTPIIGTPDYLFLQKAGRLREELGWELYDGTHLVFEPDEGIDPVELQEESIKLMRKFYSFNFFWRFSRISLVLHFLYFGFVTLAMPLLWLINLKIRHLMNFPFKRTCALAWQGAKRSYRKAKLSLGGHLIITSWRKHFDTLGLKNYWAKKN